MAETIPEKKSWRDRWYQIIFEADTPGGKAFDVVLLIAIVLSIAVICIESVDQIRERNLAWLIRVEWFFTILFTLEYFTRIACARRPLRYVFSFYGMVDLFSILPTYLHLLIPGLHSLHTIRALRLLRTFRIFKLGYVMSEANVLIHAIWGSRAKILVFLTFVVILVVILGSVMYVVEGPTSGFTSIPQSMYWAIVTMTTVGYGDIAPATPFGKLIASLIMLLGYCLIVVPTGIISAELVQGNRKLEAGRKCGNCATEGHDSDAIFCKRCGATLEPG